VSLAAAPPARATPPRLGIVTEERLNGEVQLENDLRATVAPMLSALGFSASQEHDAQLRRRSIRASDLVTRAAPRTLSTVEVDAVLAIMMQGRVRPAGGDVAYSGELQLRLVEPITGQVLVRSVAKASATKNGFSAARGAVRRQLLQSAWAAARRSLREVAAPAWICSGLARRSPRPDASQRAGEARGQ
jgi:hypothetical protein